jgi:predicted glutamine amidotransferase
MCGLVGVICKKPNGFSNKHQEIFSSLMFVDTLRGKDSTGLFVVSNEGEVYGAKEAQMAPYFMMSKEYDEAQKRAWRNGAAMIGHNRAATKGKIIDENAHPFVVDNNIVLVHNGTMRSDHKQHADVEVDSHAIAHLIHAKESVGEALGAFYGAYALIWFDVKKQELNMIRNDERPLFWMEVEDAWVWSSEVSMLEFATRRCDIKVISEPTSLPPDTLQKFTLANRSWKATSEKVEIKKPIYTPSGGESAVGDARGEFYDQVWGGEDSYLNDDAERPPFRRGSQWRSGINSLRIEGLRRRRMMRGQTSPNEVPELPLPLRTEPCNGTPSTAPIPLSNSSPSHPLPLSLEEWLAKGNQWPRRRQEMSPTVNESCSPSSTKESVTDTTSTSSTPTSTTRPSTAKPSTTSASMARTEATGISFTLRLLTTRMLSSVTGFLRKQ